MKVLCGAVLLALGGCGTFDQAPSAPIPATCEAQVYADPHVKDLLMKSAGSQFFARDHEDEVKFAKVDATRRCMQMKGLIRPGGVVERPTVHN